jgi:hypothetical protein
MIEICRDHSTNVKRWRDGQMALRWCAAGMIEAKKQFRRVNGHLHLLRALRNALDTHVAARESQPSSTVPNRRWPHSSAARGRHRKSTPVGTSSLTRRKPRSARPNSA